MKITKINIKYDFTKSGLGEICIEEIPESVLLVGRNGSGKSRLIRLLELCVKSYSEKANEGMIEITPSNDDDYGHDLMSRFVFIDESKRITTKDAANQLNEFNNCAALLEYVKLAAEGVGYSAIVTDDFIDAFIKNVGRIYLEEDYLYGYRKQTPPARVESARAGKVLEAINLHMKALVGGAIDYQYDTDENVEDERALDVRFNNQSFNLEQLSPGQKVLTKYSILFALYELLDSKKVRESVIVIDEFGRGLHPHAEIELLGQLKKYTQSGGQLWIASHSPVVITEFSAREIVTLENGAVNYFNSDALEKAIVELFGDKDNAFSLASLLASCGNYATLEFLRKCKTYPQAITASKPGDQQIEFVASAIANCEDVLDYGAGYGRIYKGLMQGYWRPDDVITYDAYDQMNDCAQYIREKYPKVKVYEKASELPVAKYDAVILCSVLHEIRVDEWIAEFEQIKNVLNDKGKLVIIEQKQLTIGEKVDPYGYIVLSRKASIILFQSDYYSDNHGNSKIHAFVIPRDAININKNLLHDALVCLKSEAAEAIENHSGSGAREGRKYGFYLQHYYNISNALEKMGCRKEYESIAKCVEGPTYENNKLTLRVEPVLQKYWFVAVSQNSPDSVWVQRASRQDSQGNLCLEAFGFSGSYAVYVICDEHTMLAFQEMQVKASKQIKATVNDIPKRAIKLLEGRV